MQDLQGTSEKQLGINAQVRELLDRKLNSFSEEEKKLLRQYQGGGGSKGATAQETLFEFFTPLWLTEKCWELAHHYGYDGGHVIEPSCATGNFFHHAPDPSKCVGFELNEYSARIAQILYPKTKVHHLPFEAAFMQEPVYRSPIRGKKRTWLEQYPFSLAIGNPPFGRYAGKYAAMMKRITMLEQQYPFQPMQFEIAFIMLSLTLLKKGGLLLFVLPQAFLRNGRLYASQKRIIGQMATFVDAYRLPPVFDASEVPTDILILKRK